MATEIKRRRGTTAEHSAFTGAPGELTVDTDKNAVVVHDGATAGGNPQLTEADIGSTVQGYDVDTAKLDVIQTWTGRQKFNSIESGVETYTNLVFSAITIPMDGRVHVVHLKDDQVTTIEGSATRAGQYATIVFVGSPAGTGSIAWAAGHRRMNEQELNTTASAYTDFVLDTPDGTTIRYRGVGVEP